jgi:hypothetical protein
MRKVNEGPISNYYFWDERAFEKGAANKGKEKRVFDWVAAAKIIKEKNPEIAEAGLQGDFEYTSGTIYEDGKVIRSESCYLSSNWATPILVINEDEVYECFIMEEQTEYNQNTMWPEEALAIIESET